MARTRRSFPRSYVHPPTESVVDGPCSQGAYAHRRSHRGVGAACNASVTDHLGWRELSFYAAVAAGAKPCRDQQCFPTHLQAVS